MPSARCGEHQVKRNSPFRRPESKPGFPNAVRDQAQNVFRSAGHDWNHNDAKRQPAGNRRESTGRFDQYEVDEDPDNNGRNADERVDRNARDTSESRITRNLGQVYSNSNAKWYPNDHGETDKDRRAQQGRGDAAPRFANGGWLLEKKIPS
jgi:hypothetical protein